MKTKKIHVYYSGQRVGELWDFGDRTGFAYAESFLASGHQLSPITMRLENWGTRPRPCNNDALEYLPGIFFDSLPDRWGQAIMFDWYAKHMGEKYIVSAADKLAYVGQNGMGALSYEPASEEYDATALRELDLAKAERESHSYVAGKSEEVLESLRAMVKTVGGSFPKALIALDPATGQTFEEKRGLPLNLEHWIVKFGVGDQRLRNDFANYPEIEIAYLDMARDCGILVPDFRFFETKREDGQRLRHLGIRRFDFVNGQRQHYASLAGLMEIASGDDFWDYQKLLRTTQEVVADFRAIKEQCRRMIFNVASANFDDHAKNHGFLYAGKEWSVSPAFDLGFWGHKPNAPQSLAVKGRCRGISFSTMKELCEEWGIKGAEVDEMGEQIRSVLEKSQAYFDKWEVPPEHGRFVVEDLKRRVEASLIAKATIATPSGVDAMVAAKSSYVPGSIRKSKLPDLPRSGDQKNPSPSQSEKSPKKGGRAN